MRERFSPVWVGAIAGLALAVLVFLPWYHLDTSSLTKGTGAQSQDVAKYLEDFRGGKGQSDDASAWDAIPNASLLWIVAGLLAVALAACVRTGVSVIVQRWVAAAGVAVGAGAVVIAVVRLLDPPYENYDAGAVPVIGVALAVVVTASAVDFLRRA